MIEKILIEINRLKNELDGYSAGEALDYIESYINTLSKQDMESYEKIKKVLALGFMNFLDDNKSKGKMCLSNGECADIEKAFNEQDWPRLAGYLDKYTESEDERIRKAIIEFIKQSSISGSLRSCLGISEEQMIAYLEKQKEQKPAEKPSMIELLREHLVNTPKEQLDAEFEELILSLPAVKFS